MSQNPFPSHDPKFTAYALGELEPGERAAVEAALRDNPAARAIVDEIRMTAAQLTAALAGEPLPETSANPSSLPVGGAAGSISAQPAGAGHLPPYAENKLIKFPQFYYMAGLAAAACFALFVALREPEYHPTKQTVAVQEKTYATIDIGASSPSVSTEEPTLERADANGPDSQIAITPVTSPLRSELRLADAAAPMNPSAGTLLDQVQVASTSTSVLAGGAAPALSPVTSNDLAVAPTVANSQGVALSGYEVSVDKDLVSHTRGIPAGPVVSNPALGAKTSAAPAVSPETLAKFDTNRNGVLDPAELAQKTSDDAKKNGDTIRMTPFQVSTEKDVGYAAANTLSGGRVDTPLKVTPGSVSGRRVTPGLSFQTETQFDAWNGYRDTGDARSIRQTQNTENYAHNSENEFLGAEQNRFSTFSIDVDTASYANVRRFIESGRLPPVDAVRIEEMINYFPYAYAQPKDDAPFGATLEVASAPWAPTHRLVRIGLKAREVTTKARPAANLVFLLDVSGSMNAPNRLPLVKESMRLLLGKLRRDDHVAIVTYAGQSGLALPSTPVSRSHEILEALDALSPGGSTNGAMGIQLAYDIAKANFVTDGLNRVILCTDGDFNVGVSSESELTRLIGEKAKSGVFLTVLGFGMGNLKDSMLEKLADKGNGNYGYIDSRREAEKLLVEQVNGTLMTVAKDVKIQVDFNPAKVASYRLIGYENRMLKKEDFNNDQVDAGEIGAGHTVTALYEIVPVGVEEEPAKAVAVDESRYAPRTTERAKVAASSKASKADKSINDELLTVKIRYKKPNGLFSQRLDFPLTDGGAEFADASDDFKFAAAVAGFGMILRDSPLKGSATIGDILSWIGNETGDDHGEHRHEFIDLVTAARRLLR